MAASIMTIRYPENESQMKGGNTGGGGAFPRDEFDHTSSKNESIIQNTPTKAGVEAFLVFAASLLRGALFLCGLH